MYVRTIRSKKGDNMNYKQVVVGVVGITAAVVICGCVHKAVVVEDDDSFPGSMTLEAKHAHLESILGINDVVLADTNRFVLGEGSYRHEFKLGKPFGGFVEACVYLDKMEDFHSRRSDGKPHRLRSVNLRRRLPDGLTDKEAVFEWQAACDFVADMLDVESPEVELVDVEEWRTKAKAFMEIGEVRSSVTFCLADDQDIDVRLTETIYVMRDGRAIQVRPGYIEIALMYNRSLCIGGGGRQTARDEEKVEKEIAFGPDCSDKLAETFKVGIARRAKHARRKQGKEDGSKTK